MMYSMTGFGKSHFFQQGKKVNIEIKSLNSKQIDFSLKTPSAFKDKEMEIRNLVLQTLLRGKIDVTISIDQTLPLSLNIINHNTFNAYLDEIKQIEREFNLSFSGDYLSLILSLPDVLSFNETAMSDDEWVNLKTCVEDCICQLKYFRLQEGNALKEDFILRISNIQNYSTEIAAFEAERIVQVRAKLREQFNQLQLNIDENRFEQEIIYYLEKIDITEEKVRLKNHCEYFLQVLDNEEESKGKLLNFISQEIGRELNTLGSKAYDTNIQHLVVKMKDESEKIKEQLLNVL